ncbi:phosphatidic acid phosphatase type 2/haloperoxidase [Hyaloraphidium curvatum]|nr:phosphatidic acid phosphatase type 2/haloperoxidase [Hyaloraphidium curvatum]
MESPAARWLRFPPRPACLALVRSYALDWAVPVALLIATALVNAFAPVTQRVFSLDDAAISYPLSSETFPNWLLYVLAVAVPVVCCSALALLRRSLLELHSALLGLAFALSLTVLLTESFKVYVGALRPDFISRCAPNWPAAASSLAGGIASTGINFGGQPPGPLRMFNGTVCTGSSGTVEDGRKAFPSGHASLSFAGLGFLSLHLAMAKGWMFSSPRPAYLAPAVVALAPAVLAACIAVSRVIDYRHSPLDVAAGSVLGMLAACWAFGRYFRPLWAAGEPGAWGDRVEALVRGKAGDGAAQGEHVV